MTPATQEPFARAEDRHAPRAYPPQTMSPHGGQPPVPPTGEPPPVAARELEEHPADEPGYGHGV